MCSKSYPSQHFVYPVDPGGAHGCIAKCTHVDAQKAWGMHSLLELGTTCMHDYEINTPNIQAFLCHKNDIYTTL